MKNVLLDSKKTVSRKVREAVMAIQLERTHTKEAILEGYLNRIYLGNGAYGVQAASQHVLRQAGVGVTLAEAALLAGMIQAPESYDPFTSPDAARDRRQLVLGRMRELGSAPASDIAAAEAAPLGVGAKRPTTPATQPATSLNGSSGSSSTTSASAPPRPTAAGSSSRRACESAPPSICGSRRLPRTR